MRFACQNVLACEARAGLRASHSHRCLVCEPRTHIVPIWIWICEPRTHINICEPRKYTFASLAHSSRVPQCSLTTNTINWIFYLIYVCVRTTTPTVNAHRARRDPTDRTRPTAAAWHGARARAAHRQGVGSALGESKPITETQPVTVRSDTRRGYPALQSRPATQESSLSCGEWVLPRPLDMLSASSSIIAEAFGFAPVCPRLALQSRADPKHRPSHCLPPSRRAAAV